MSVKLRRGVFIVDVTWPDGIRWRKKMPDEDTATRIDAMIAIAKVDVVLAGKDKGKRGVVVKVIGERDRIIVENVNMVKRHTKGNPMQGTAGGIVEKEMPIHISNIAIWNPAGSPGPW